MTLKEKLSQYAKQEVWEKRNYNAEECEQIADEFAIGFAEWLDFKYYQGEDFNEYYRSVDEYREGKHFTATQLLEIYKKEKGL